MIRRINNTDLWIEVMCFWEVASTKELVISGPTYQKSTELLYSFPILIEKCSQMVVKVDDINHVNDFIDCLNGRKILLRGII